MNHNDDMAEIKALEEALLGSISEPSDDEKFVVLSRRGIEIGAYVRGPESGIGKVTEIGRSIKDHSKADDKKKNFYVTVARSYTTRNGRVAVRHTNIQYENALTLRVITA